MANSPTTGHAIQKTLFGGVAPGPDWRTCCGNCEGGLKPDVRPGPLGIPLCRDCDTPEGHDRVFGPRERDDGAATIRAGTDLEAEPWEGPVLDVPFEGHFGPACVACPTCHVLVGAYCKRPSGHQGPLVAFHASRQRLAGRVRLVGLRCHICGTEDRPGRFVAPITDAGPGQPPVGTLLCTQCADDYRLPLRDAEDERLDPEEE